MVLKSKETRRGGVEDHFLPHSRVDIKACIISSSSKSGKGFFLFLPCQIGFVMATMGISKKVVKFTKNGKSSQFQYNVTFSLYFINYFLLKYV